MPMMGKMLRTISTEDVFQRVQVMMVKRRDEYHRQDDRQQPGGKYVPFPEHNGDKGTKKKN